MKYFNLLFFPMCLLFGLCTVAFNVGKTEGMTEAARIVDIQYPDCKLEESRAIKGCEIAAMQMMNAEEEARWHGQQCEKRASHWQNRANQCATLCIMKQNEETN